MNESIIDDEEKEIVNYVVKHGLRGFLCPLLNEDLSKKLLHKIRDDCKTVSRLIIKTSWLVLTFYTHYFTTRPSEASERFKKLDVLNLSYFLKSNARKTKSF